MNGGLFMIEGRVKRTYDCSMLIITAIDVLVSDIFLYSDYALKEHLMAFCVSVFLMLENRFLWSSNCSHSSLKWTLGELFIYMFVFKNFVLFTAVHDVLFYLYLPGSLFLFFLFVFFLHVVIVRFSCLSLEIYKLLSMFKIDLLLWWSLNNKMYPESW